MLNKGKSQIKEYYVHIPFVYVFLVKARTFPNLHGTYILEGPAQVTQVRTEYTSGQICVRTRFYSWKPNCSTLEPDWSQYNSPTTCIIVQQYSSTRISEMLFQFLYFLQLQHMKVRDLKLCKAGSVCTSFMFLIVTGKPAGCFVLIHSLMQTVTVLVFWLLSYVRPFTQMW